MADFDLAVTISVQSIFCLMILTSFRACYWVKPVKGSSKITVLFEVERATKSYKMCFSVAVRSLARVFFLSARPNAVTI